MGLQKDFVVLDCIEGLNGIYLISRDGLVYGKRSKRILKSSDNRLGYKQVYLTFFNGGGRWFKVHRLVAKQFIPNPDNLTDVNHKNHDKGDNRVDNLEWLSHSDNIRHSYLNGRRSGVAGVHLKKAIYCLTNGKTYSSAVEASKDTGCKTSNISMCVNGRISHSREFKFRFV